MLTPLRRAGRERTDRVAVARSPGLYYWLESGAARNSESACRCAAKGAGRAMMQMIHNRGLDDRLTRHLRSQQMGPGLV
jgi:hypothetical protein